MKDIELRQAVEAFRVALMTNKATARIERDYTDEWKRLRLRAYKKARRNELNRGEV